MLWNENLCSILVHIIIRGVRKVDYLIESSSANYSRVSSITIEYLPSVYSFKSLCRICNRSRLDNLNIRFRSIHFANTIWFGHRLAYNQYWMTKSLCTANIKWPFWPKLCMSSSFSAFITWVNRNLWRNYVLWSSLHTYGCF